MATYESGDYIKVELTDEVAGGGEWLAEAALMACIPDYVLLRPVLLELKRRYPGADEATRASPDDIIGVVLQVPRRGSFSPAVAERWPAPGKAGGDCPQNPLGGLAETADS